MAVRDGLHGYARNRMGRPLLRLHAYQWSGRPDPVPQLAPHHELRAAVRRDAAQLQLPSGVFEPGHDRNVRVLSYFGVLDDPGFVSSRESPTTVRIRLSFSRSMGLVRNASMPVSGSIQPARM